MLLKINRPQIGLFFLRKIGASRFDTPVPSIFNPIFQFYYLWKFLSDLIQILHFRVKLFDTPPGCRFQPEIPFQKILEFHADPDQISQIIHIQILAR